jgi:hypothetical protein
MVISACRYNHLQSVYNLCGYDLQCCLYTTANKLAKVRKEKKILNSVE